MLSREEATAILLEERLLLTAYLNVVARNHHLAEDTFQDICVQSLVRKDSFESRDHLLNWARLSGRNRILNVLRSRETRCDVLDEATMELLAASWPSRQSDESSRCRDLLSQCLKELTPNNRELIRLRYFEGRTGSEVARLLGRKLATVYQAMARIHKTLADCLQVRLATSEEH